MIDEIFKYTAVNFEKLKKYGFIKAGGEYVFETQILKGQFSVKVSVDGESRVTAKVFDNDSNEEYILHLVGGVGEFVGSVRRELEGVLCDIRDKCFDREVYKYAQTKLLIDFVRKSYGEEPEYLWEKFPTDAIFRRADNRKWYGVIMAVESSKLNPDESGVVEVLDIRCESEKIDRIADGKKYFRGYHMNKKNWLTIKLDGTVSADEMFELVKSSRELVK